MGELTRTREERHAAASECHNTTMVTWHTIMQVVMLRVTNYKVLDVRLQHTEGLRSSPSANETYDTKGRLYDHTWFLVALH